MFGRKNSILKPGRLIPRKQTLDSRFKRSLPTKKPHFTGRFKKIFILIIFTAAIIFSLYGIVFSDTFKIKNIIITNKDFSNQSLSDQIKKSLKTYQGKSIFWLNLSEIAQKILNQSPELEKVKVSKDYPDSINIEFFEYPLAANIINESSTLKKTYLINSLGFTVKEDFEKPDLPYIKIKSDEPINTKNAVIDKAKLNYILNAITYFNDKFGMKVKEVLYKPIPREVHLLTERNFYIWLDIQRPFESQFKKLKKAIVKLDIYSENLQYIDLRIAESSGDKIIYKRRK